MVLIYLEMCHYSGVDERGHTYNITYGQLIMVSLIPVYHYRIWYFPVMGVKSGRGEGGVGGGGALHVSK